MKAHADHAEKPRPAARDARIDALRGLALVVMTLDHFRGSFRAIGYQALGFVTAAEIFVFLSGLVAGIVYTERLRIRPFETVRAACRRRAGLLYVYHLTAFTAVLVLAWASEPLAAAWRAWIPLFSEELLFEDRPLALGLAALLLYQPAYLDILPMYAVFLFLVPPALRLLDRRGSAVLAIIALAVWLAAQSGRTQALFAVLLDPWDLRPPFFDPFAWQGLFFLGLACGWARTRAQPWLHGLIRRGWLPALAMSISLLLLRHEVIPAAWLPAWLDVPSAISVPRLGWLRLANFLCLALATAGLAARWPGLFRRPWLALLGRHSLQVYTAHLAAVFLLAPVWMRIAHTGWRAELPWYAAALGLLTATALLHEVHTRRLRRARREESVACTGRAG